jgi:hypothetical protein
LEGSNIETSYCSFDSWLVTLYAPTREAQPPLCPTNPTVRDPPEPPSDTMNRDSERCKPAWSLHELFELLRRIWAVACFDRDFSCRESCSPDAPFSTSRAQETVKTQKKATVSRKGQASVRIEKPRPSTPQIRPF